MGNGFSVNGHLDAYSILDEEDKLDSFARKTPREQTIQLDKDVHHTLRPKMGRVEQTVYDLSSKYHFDLHRFGIERFVTTLTKHYEAALGNATMLQEELKGQVDYEPPASDTPESFKQMQYVPEEDKGLRYKCAEQFDRLRIARLQWQRGEAALDEYRNHLQALDQDIDTLRKSNNPSDMAKAAALTGEKQKVARDKRSLEDAQSDWYKKVSTYHQNWKTLESQVLDRDGGLRDIKKVLDTIGADLAAVKPYVEEGRQKVNMTKMYEAVDHLQTEAQGLWNAVRKYDQFVLQKRQRMRGKLTYGRGRNFDRPEIQKIRELNNTGFVEDRQAMETIGRDIEKYS